MRAIAKGDAERRGSAALEFGLAMPFLLVAVIGVAEVGMAAYEAMQVQDAAEAGALYASQNPTDFAGIANAVVAATGTPGIAATPVPASFCGCPGAGGIAEGDCSAPCPDGSPQSVYVRVSAELTHAPMLTFPGFPDPLVLRGRSTIRTQ